VETVTVEHYQQVVSDLSEWPETHKMDWAKFRSEGYLYLLPECCKV